MDVTNVDDPSAIGTYHSRTDTSLGTELVFKSIKGAGGVTVTESGGIITIDASGGGGGSSDPYVNDDPVVVTVGGITQDSSFFYTPGKSFQETMEAMFYPVQFPTLTNPSSSFSDNAASLQEIGDDISIQFTSSFSRGSINPQYDASSAFRSGPGNTVRYTGTGLVDVGSYPSSPNVQTVNPYTVLIGTQTWTNYWEYDEGVQPYDSNGDPYDSPLPAGSTSTDSLSFEGVYPLFGTTVNITTYTQQSLVSMLSGNNVVFGMVAESGGNKQTFDIPDAWTGAPTSRPLAGIETFNTVSSSWEYEGGSASASLTFWTTSTTTHSIQGNTINYTRYVYNGPDRSGIQIRLKF